MDWETLQNQCGASYHYCGEHGLKALELIIGEDVILEATRGTIELHPQWMLMEGVLRILKSPTAIHEAYRIYKNTADAWIKTSCIRMMREIPNACSLKYFAEFLADSDVSMQAVQLLEKQLWYSPALREDSRMVKLVEMAECHPDANVRQEAIGARAHLHAA